MSKVRLGIIGVGTQGGFYANLLTGQSSFPGMPASGVKLDKIELGALCDNDPAVKARCAERYRLLQENARLRAETEAARDLGQIVGDCAKMRELRALERSLVGFVADCDAQCAGGPGPDCGLLGDLGKRCGCGPVVP